MTRRTAFLVGIIVLVHASASAQTGARYMNDPVVHAGVLIMGPNGRSGSGAAVQTGDRVGADLGGTVYLAPCSTVGAADRGHAISAAATDVWQLSGRVLELGAEQASIQVGWQRIRRNGQDDASSPQSLTFTLQRGERKTLESITVPATGSCAERSASLDVAFVSRRELFSPAGSGSSASDAIGNDGQLRSVVAELRGGVMGARAADQPAPASVTAELWLVRSTPGRADETLHLASSVSPIPRPFAFTPITIQTASGALTIKVEGTIETGQSPEGERRFYFSANRTVTFAPVNGPPRDSAVRTVESSLKTTVTMPGPEEVLSFELPPLKIPGGAAVPDQLSIRVRLTPVETIKMIKKSIGVFEP
jgi:hypothetical protein